MSVQILVGDAVAQMATLPDKSVHCCVTSPPYFGLRDYKVEGQLGLEKTPEEYVDKLVEVFREVRRVLRDDGTLWLNLGDSYNGSGGQGTKPNIMSNEANAGRGGKPIRIKALGDKQLLGIPWRVAFALQADGWILRQDIIWHKPNPMPESVRDRCTKSHEYMFLFSKSKRYYFDSEAIKEPAAMSSVERLSQPTLFDQIGSSRVPGKTNGNMKAVGHLPGNKTHKGQTAYESGDKMMRTKAGIVDYCKRVAEDPSLMMKRNPRSVWTVTTRPYKGAHFATFPPKLIEPCVKAGCPVDGTVLDPFAGSGTTGQVAKTLGRCAVLIELNPEYVPLIEKRLAAIPS